MSKPLQEYYDDRFDLLAHPGWIDFMEDIDLRIKAIESIKGIKSEEELFKRQGELSALEWIKSLKELSLTAYEQLKADGDIK